MGPSNGVGIINITLHFPPVNFQPTLWKINISKDANLHLAVSTCLGASFVHTIQPCTSLQRHFIQSHICSMHVCLAVTCHLHFWQNDQDLVCATVVTQRHYVCTLLYESSDTSNYTNASISHEVSILSETTNSNKYVTAMSYSSIN